MSMLCDAIFKCHAGPPSQYPKKGRIAGKSQSSLILINPMISTRTRRAVRAACVMASTIHTDHARTQSDLCCGNVVLLAQSSTQRSKRRAALE
jgi:hypothetical protein